VVADLDDAGRSALQREVVERWERLGGAGPMTLELDVATVTARKPERTRPAANPLSTTSIPAGRAPGGRV